MEPKSPRTKIDSSELINDLLNDQCYASNKNWLISYLDVFVLVVMLMVTLVSLSEFKKQPKPTKQDQVKLIEAPQREAPKKNELKPTTPPSLVPPVIQPNTESPVDHSIEAVSEPEIIAPLQPSEKSADLLPSIEATPDKNLQLHDQLQEQIKNLGLENSFQVSFNQGFAELEIQDKVLFQSSAADLTPSGKELLAKLIPILTTSVGLILIEGHTDNKIIKTKQFPSNWELGASRANSVLHVLMANGIAAERLRAISFADTKPIADNSTPEGREKNRRVNIVVKVENQKP